MVWMFCSICFVIFDVLCCAIVLLRGLVGVRTHIIHPPGFEVLVAIRRLDSIKKTLLASCEWIEGFEWV